MKFTVIRADRNGNPINTLSNPDTIKELVDFLTEVYYQIDERIDVNKMKIV